MSTKEYITLIIDASKLMEAKSVASQDATDFQLALKFAIDMLSKQLLRNRKSDRYSILIYTPTDVQFVYYNEPVSLSRVREFYDMAIKTHDNAVDSPGDYCILDALAEALQSQIANKFVRSIYIVTNGAGTISDANTDLDELKNIAESYPVITNLLLLNNEHNAETKSYFENLAAMFDGRLRISDFEAFTSSGPPLKLIGPRCMTDCSLSFIQGGLQGEGIHLNVQVYPAIRAQSQVSGHEFIQDPKTKDVTRVKRSTKYYIKENTDISDEIFVSTRVNNKSSDLENDKEYVKDSEYMYGFKYSQRNVVALLPELEEAATLETSPGINIMGFIDRKHLPVAYLTDEPSYVIPSVKSEAHNKVAFNSLVQALIELQSVSIVRYVQKETDEVQICCALPQRFRVGEKWGYGFVLNRLAMKEDEKIGRFPDLESSGQNALDSTMETFVSAMKLRNDATEPDVLNNIKIGLLESKSTASSPRQNFNFTLEDMLLSSCPATKRYNHYIEKILYSSLNEASLTDFVSQDQFIERYLTGDEKQTLLNLGNVFDVEENLLYTDDHKSANSIEATVKSVFDINFTTQSKPSRKKRKTDTVFGMENNDEFDEYFDIDEILAG
ncbi:hypothetical protein K4G60_g2132 [Candida parapsilosis]|nr:hypothetical protein K4G60_g2132 [Candida parapsilosis]